MKADNARRRLLGFETDNKSSYWIRSVTKDVLKNVAKFTQKNLCRPPEILSILVTVEAAARGVL